MKRRRKLLEMTADSPASGARFVRLRYVVPDSLTVKDLLARRLTKLLHDISVLTISKNTNFEEIEKNKKEIVPLKTKTPFQVG